MQVRCQEEIPPGCGGLFIAIVWHNRVTTVYTIIT